MTAIIADDEELARRLLREYLEGQSGIEILAEAANGFDAVKAVSELKPDVLFLDVQMPRLDGFEVLELIGGEVAVVFVTAFDQYAMKAFDAAAVDYLLKPYSAERLHEALARVRRRLGEPRPAPAAIAVIEAIAWRRVRDITQRLRLVAALPAFWITASRLPFSQSWRGWASPMPATRPSSRNGGRA